MADKQGFIYMEDVIMSYKASKGDNTMHKFITYLHYALKGYRELNLSIVLQPRTALVKLDGLKRANLNILDGFRGLSKVGVREGDRIRTFQPDSSIATTFDKNDSGKNTAPEPYVDAVINKGGVSWYEIYFYNFIDENGAWRNILGYGNGHNGIGYFNYDRSTGYIYFDANVSYDEVLVEYIKDVYEVGTKTMVPESIANYLEEYVRWWEKRIKLGDAHKETMAQAQIMTSALGDAIMSYDDLTPQSITNILNRSTVKMQ